MRSIEWQLAAIALVALVGSFVFAMLKEEEPLARDYQQFCQHTEFSGQSSWHAVIYIDEAACLACSEVMQTWLELEKSLIANGGMLSLWAPAADSSDVAVAMKMEGVHTEVKVLGAEVIESLGWNSKRTPIKLLFGRGCRPVMYSEGGSSLQQSRRFTDHMIHLICSKSEMVSK